MTSIKYNTAHVLLERVAADWVDEVRDTLELNGGDPAYELLDTGGWSYKLEQWAKNHDGGIDGAKLDLAHGLMFGYDRIEENGRLEQKFVISTKVPESDYLRLYMDADGTVAPLCPALGQTYAPAIGGDHILTGEQVASLTTRNMVARAFVVKPVVMDVINNSWIDGDDEHGDKNTPATLSRLNLKLAHEHNDGESFYVFIHERGIDKQSDTRLLEYMKPDGDAIHLFTHPGNRYAPNINSFVIYTFEESRALLEKGNAGGYVCHIIHSTSKHWEDA